MNTIWLILFLLISFVCSQSIYARDNELIANLKKIQLFKSNRKDVEKLFKYQSFKEVRQYNHPDWLYTEKAIEEAKKTPPGYYSVYYDLKDAKLDLTYSNGKCSAQNKEGYDLDKDTVINMSILFPDDFKLSKLKFDLTKFTKEKVKSDIEFTQYTSQDLGIEMQGNEKYITSIDFNPLPYQVERYRCEEDLTSDSEMERIFKEKREIFNKLAEMSDADSEFKVITTDSKFAFDNSEEFNQSYSGNKQSKLPVERWENYKNLFKEINLKGSLIRRDEESPVSIYLNNDFKYYYLTSASKGYVYSKEPLTPAIESIDSILKPLKTNEEKAKEFFKAKRLFYRKLSDNWYIYYEYDYF